MAEIQMLPVQSSNIVAAGFDAESETCRIQFKNGVYEYPNFPPDLWAKFSATFQTSESSGKFFAANIRTMQFKKIS